MVSADDPATLENARLLIELLGQRLSDLEKAEMERIIEAVVPALAKRPPPAFIDRARRNAEARADFIRQYEMLDADQVHEFYGSKARNRSALAARWRKRCFTTWSPVASFCGRNSLCAHGAMGGSHPSIRRYRRWNHLGFTSVRYGQGPARIRRSAEDGRFCRDWHTRATRSGQRIPPRAKGGECGRDHHCRGLMVFFREAQPAVLTQHASMMQRAGIF